jgi:NADPH:quinone reductase-like Zn-dependent oxidoreductase
MEPTVKEISMKEQGNESSVLRHIRHLVAEEYRLFERGSLDPSDREHFVVDVKSADLARLADMFNARELMTSVGTVLPLTEARTAHEMLERKGLGKCGKIVLQVAA